MQSLTAGPDLVLVGAARSGTSALAAQLGAHPHIDPGKVKESNYFSRKFDRGAEWYEALYADRREGRVRLDASTSYTSPEFPDALSRLAEASPEAFIIYSVRQPTERALSHFSLRHHYFENDHSRDFGSALRASSFYLDASDYSHWIPKILEIFGEAQLLVVPFEMITTRPSDVTSEICRQVGLAPPPLAESQGTRHRNDVVRYRSETMRKAGRRFRQSPAYPWMRHIVGAERLRKARGLVTQKADLPGFEEAMRSCAPAQRHSLDTLESTAGETVRNYLTEQDSRLDLNWASSSFSAAPPDYRLPVRDGADN